MGCDIHAFLEAKPKESKEWTSAEPQDLARNYGIFGFLANVRKQVPSPFMPKGLPKDISKQVKYDYEYWYDNSHSMSYLNLAELQEAYDRYSKYWNESVGDDYLSIIPKMKQLELDGWDCRLVFWFDC